MGLSFLQWRRRGVRRRQQSARHQAGSRPRVRNVSAKPNSRQRCSFTKKISLAGWPLPMSVGYSRPDAFAVRDLWCWEFLLVREGQAVQRYMRLALCLDPAQALVTFVSWSSQFARSLQKATCLLANLSTLPKHLHGCGQFCISPETHAHSRKSSRSTPKFSTAADQEGELSSDWAASMPRCSAFYAQVTNSHKLSLQRKKKLLFLRKPGVERSLLSFPNSAKSHCDDFRRLRPGRKRRLCARSEGQWPRFDMKLAGARTSRPRRSTRCPLHTRRGLISHRSARGSGRVRCRKKPVQVAHCRGDAQGEDQRIVVDDDSSQMQIRATTKQALQVEQQQRRKEQRRFKLRLGRDLLAARPARPCDCSRQFP